jgi:dipeptidyl aminopeptidase/acylaminoacyl peptidase
MKRKKTLFPVLLSLIVLSSFILSDRLNSTQDWSSYLKDIHFSPGQASQFSDDSPFPPERDAVYRKLLKFGELVKDASLQPNWMADGKSFWYVEGEPAKTTIIKVDPADNTVEPLFDTERLRASLTPVLGYEPPYKGLPFTTFQFLDDEKAIRFELEKRVFRVELDSYTITELEGVVPSGLKPSSQPPSALSPEIPGPRGLWTAVAKDYNLYLRSSHDGRLVALTKDGEEKFYWSLGSRFRGQSAKWSPDGTRLVAFKEDIRNVHQMPVVHWLKANKEEITYQTYPGTGEMMLRHELYVFDVRSGIPTLLDLGDTTDHGISPLSWRPDGSEILVLRVERLMKKLDMLAVNPKTGESRILFSEQQPTFIEGLAFDPQNLFYPFSDGTKFVWLSERDNWSHLYLYGANGKLIRKLTAGEIPVDRVATIDEENGLIYYLARDDRTRPYDVHLHRVDIEGKQSTRLTEATGVHTPVFAPGKEYFLDTHSTIDRPPSVELRKVDGTKLRVLKTADISALTELKWQPPEEFKVKAADGETDLYGALYKPYDFDPSKKYPVVDLQYMGNFVHSAPRTFVGTWLGDDAQALTQLGFIVFIVDARGTPGRGKAFQDFTYNNVGKVEVPDHVATLKQLAETRPYMDTTRVGITGYSWGGYFTLRALLTAPDVFHVGISGAPVVDFIAATAPIEPYMGLPQDNVEGYQQGSNVLLADKLKGKLLIVIGTSDVNVTFNHTMRMANALIKANKFFDLIVMPEETHGLRPPAMAYYREARDRYFVEHLKPFD